jgi:hypothetical protein
VRTGREHDGVASTPGYGSHLLAVLVSWLLVTASSGLVLALRLLLSPWGSR